MGLRERVTIAIVIIALIQIACRHCMPNTSKKASLKRYLNDLKPKNNPVSTPISQSRVNKTPKQTFRKTAQNARVSQNSSPNKSLYKAYNFPENEFPLDNSPRDGFRVGVNFNDNHCPINNLQRSGRNLGSTVINDLKKEMKMKRKMLNNRQLNHDNGQLQREISTIKFTPNSDSIHLFDSETFPEVQYPLNTMETWGPNYWNYLNLPHAKPFNGYEQQQFNSKTINNINKPFTRLTKATASKFLQSYDKLKEEQRRTTSTENSKRSNKGQKGLNFTKTATCERVSDDFIAATLISNILNNLTETKQPLESTSEITPSSENTCPVAEYSYHLMPIPYRVIEKNSKNPAFELKNNTEELQDANNSVIEQTLQLIEEILVSDDTSSTVLPENLNTDVQNNMNTSNYTDVPIKENVPTILMDCAKTCAVTPTEKLLINVSDDTPIDICQNQSIHVAEAVENTTTIAGPMSTRIPLPFTDFTTYGAMTNASNLGPATLSNVHVVPGSTSIIIIPVNAGGKSQSHMIESTSDTPIILYIPTIQSRGFPSRTQPTDQYISLSLEKPVPNNKLYNDFSNVAPLQNDNPYSNTLVSELLNDISDSGSSLPIYETLPTNSKCNENSPSLTREKSFSHNLIHKSLIDDAHFAIPTYDEKSLKNQSAEIYSTPDTLPVTPNFKHPLFDFASSDFVSLSYGPYNNIINDELPIITREINSNQQISSATAKHLFIPTQKVLSECLQKNISNPSNSEDSLFEIPIDVPVVALDKNCSPGTITDRLEILKNYSPLPNSLPTLQAPLDNPIFSSPIFEESLPQSIDKILLSTPPIDALNTRLPLPRETCLTPIPVSETASDKLPVIKDAKLSPSPVIEITINNELQMSDITPMCPMFTSSPTVTENITFNTALLSELYKIRQIIDKMLSSEIPRDSNSDDDSLALTINHTLLPDQMSPHSLPLLEEDKTLLPLPETNDHIDSLLQIHETLQSIPIYGNPDNTLSLPVDKLPTSNIVDSPPVTSDDIELPTPVSDPFTTNEHLIDNLVVPMQNATSHTNDILYNDLPHTMDGLPTKMELMVPNIDKVSSYDLSVPFDSDDTKINYLPIIIHQEYTTKYKNPENTLSLPVDKLSISNSVDRPLETIDDIVLTTAVPDPSSDNKLHLMDDSVSMLQNVIFRTNDIPNNDLRHTVDDLPSKMDFMDPDTDKVSSSNLSVSSDSDDTEINDLPIIVHQDHTKNYKNPENNLSSPVDRLTISNIIDRSPITIDNTVLLTAVSDPSIDNKLHFMDNLVTPIQNVTFYTNDIPNNNLPLKIDNLPSKMDLLVFDIDEVSGDVLPASYDSNDTEISDLPIIVDQQHTRNGNPENNLSSPVDKLPISNIIDSPPITIDNTVLTTSVSDTPHTDNKLYFMDNLVTPLKTVISRTNYIPNKNLPYTTDDLSSNMDFIVPGIDKISSEDLRVSYGTEINNLPIIVNQEHTTNLQSGLPTNDWPIPLVETITPLSKVSVNDAQNPIIRSSLSMDEVFETDLPALSVNAAILGDLNSTNLNKHNDEVLSKSSLSDIPRDDSLLLIDKISPGTGDTLTDFPLPINKVPSTSKLPITKALLETVLADITNGGLYSSVAKTLPVTPPSLLDKTLYYVDENSPVSVTHEAPVLPVKETASILEQNANPIDRFKFLKHTNVSPTTYVSSVLPIDEIEKDKPDIPTYDIENVDIESPLPDINKASPQSLVDKILPNTAFSDLLNDNNNLQHSRQSNDTMPQDNDRLFPKIPNTNISKQISSPTNKILSNNNDALTSSITENLNLSIDPITNQQPLNNKTPSSTKLSITKALLENMLSDINTKGFTLPEAKVLSVSPRSQLDKTLYFLETPLPDVPTPPFSEIIEDISSLPIDKMFSNNPDLDHCTDQLPIDKMCADNLEILTMEDKDLNNNSGNPTDDIDDHLTQMDKKLYFSDALDNLPIPKSKPQLLASRIPITKALLQKVLTDITEGALAATDLPN